MNWIMLNTKGVSQKCVNEAQQQQSNEKHKNRLLFAQGKKYLYQLGSKTFGKQLKIATSGAVNISNFVQGFMTCVFLWYF